MPIKPMRCGRCDEPYEWFKLSSREIPQCPTCNATEEQAEEFPKRGAFQLKGSDWSSRGGYS